MNTLLSYRVVFPSLSSSCLTWTHSSTLVLGEWAWLGTMSTPVSLLFPVCSVCHHLPCTHPEAGEDLESLTPLHSARPGFSFLHLFARQFPKQLLSTLFCWFVSFLFSFAGLLLGFRGTRETCALALSFYPEVKAQFII